MLVELAVRNLGVIAELRLVLDAGMTVLTGETGAGKTMLVEAIELLVGGKADPTLVRPGTEEATIEGRFVGDDNAEVVLTRVIPAVGRSRAYIDGRIAPAAALAACGEQLVDLHGQHAHQSLLGASTQRAALDAFAAIDLESLRTARREVARVDAALATLGGDERARAREIDLLSFQVRELSAAGVADPDEDEQLAAEEDLLGDAQAHQEAAAGAVDALTGDDATIDALGTAIAIVAGRAPFAAAEARLRIVAAELTDIACDLRSLAEGLDDDPDRLAALTARRQNLRDLRRKYGQTLAEVMAFADEAAARLEELTSRDARAAALDGERITAAEELARQGALVAAARRAAAPQLAAAVQVHLAELAMAKATVAVEVGGDGPADDVAFLLAANPGAPLLPLSKVASGGELARAMLALRLVLAASRDRDAGGPSTLVFDEVDAGVGGAAATSVGRALAALADDRQVLVVTHLPQVAAFADHQVVVAKADDGSTTTATAVPVEGDDRVIELSRMLSGSPESATARDHAAELLEQARSARS